MPLAVCLNINNERLRILNTHGGRCDDDGLTSPIIHMNHYIALTVWAIYVKPSPESAATDVL